MIRKMEIQDIPFLVRELDENFREAEVFGILTCDKIGFSDRLFEIVARGFAWIDFEEEMRGALIGGGIAPYLFNPAEKIGICQLIFTSKKYRKQGVADGLFDHFENEMRDQGATIISFAGSEEMLKWTEKKGTKKVQVRYFKRLNEDQDNGDSE